MAGRLRPDFEHRVDCVTVSGLLNAPAVHALSQDFQDDPKGPKRSRVWTLGVFGAWLGFNGSTR